MSQTFTPSKLKEVYRLEVEVISPTQVGSGAKLLPDIDYYEDNAGVHVVNLEKLLADPQLLADKDKRLEKLILSGDGRLRLNDLRRLGFMRDEFVAYSITSGWAEEREVVAQVRDGADRPYLPGSSLKGAFRTILAWKIYHDQQAAPDFKDPLNPNEAELKDPRRNLKKLRERADDRLEGRFFVAPNIPPGQRPNYDLMKLFQVDDLYPEGGTSDNLRLEDVQIFVRSQQNGALKTKNRPIAAEMWRVQTRFSGFLSIDKFWRESKSAEKLKYERGKGYLADLADLGRKRAAALIQTELKFFRECAPERNCQEMLNWYQNLQQDLAQLAPDEFFMPLGWSTGWNGKSYGENLSERADFSLREEDRQGIRQAFQLGHWESPKSPFPISRKLILDYDENNQPYAYFPPGWLKVRLSLKEG
jgi:CRISPR-associated protein Csm5